MPDVALPIRCVRENEDIFVSATDLLRAIEHGADKGSVVKFLQAVIEDAKVESLTIPEGALIN